MNYAMCRSQTQDLLLISLALLGQLTYERDRQRIVGHLSFFLFVRDRNPPNMPSQVLMVKYYENIIAKKKAVKTFVSCGIIFSYIQYIFYSWRDEGSSSQGLTLMVRMIVGNIFKADHSQNSVPQLHTFTFLPHPLCIPQAIILLT